MKNKERFRDLKVSMVGLARSGFACAMLLDRLGARVSVTDQADNEGIRLNKARLKDADIRIETGGHSKGFIEGSDLVVVSPGVTDQALPMVWARESGIPVISEIEVASALCQGEIIAVTGSNGKTTVTTLIGEAIERSGRRAFVCGNIGNPFCGEVERIEQGDLVCLEVSSFQLERIKDFKPKVAVILNFGQNHLDRYGSMQDYLAAKKRIFMNQDQEDYLVLNSQDRQLKALGREVKARVVYFEAAGRFNPNQAALVEVCSILKVDQESVFKVLSGFKGIEHRLEEVMEVDGVSFINDSKSTSVDSALWALSNTPGPIVLIAGGRDKGCDYAAMRSHLGGKVKRAILIGEASGKIEQALKGALELERAPSLASAVRRAFKTGGAGSRVLFSPMCSSFDMFRDYQERGEKFKEEVRALARERSHAA